MGLCVRSAFRIVDRERLNFSPPPLAEKKGSSQTLLAIAEVFTFFPGLKSPRSIHLLDPSDSAISLAVNNLKAEFHRGFANHSAAFFLPTYACACFDETGFVCPQLFKTERELLGSST